MKSIYTVQFWNEASKTGNKIVSQWCVAAESEEQAIDLCDYPIEPFTNVFADADQPDEFTAEEWQERQEALAAGDYDTPVYVQASGC